MIRSLRAVLPVALAFIAAPAAAQDCDRACMAGLITTYIDALVAHDPSQLPLAPGARVTEDGKDAKLGEGLWRTVTARAGFRQDYLDTAKRVAAAQVELREGTVPVLYSLVLHLDGRRIAGIETLVYRVTPDSRFQPKELGKPIRGMNDPVPAGQAQDRASLVAAALTYPAGLRIGNFTDAGTPFAPDAYRVENGVILAGEGCGRADCGLYTQNIILHPAIVRSVAAVDEENGTVLLWMNFGDTGSYGPGKALVAFEGFKIWGGQIRSINAFFGFLPFSTARYWPSTDPLP